MFVLARFYFYFHIHLITGGKLRSRMRMTEIMQIVVPKPSNAFNDGYVKL